MLVIFSDIHLTDESTAVNVSGEAFSKVLETQIMNNAVKKHAKEVNIILLGDIFDLVRTEFWLDESLVKKNERPWNGKLDLVTGMNSNPKVEEHYKEALKRIFKSESSIAFFDMLNNIRKTLTIPMKVTYVIGNHDRAFNNFPSLQQMIKDKLDSFQQHEIIFDVLYVGDEYSTFCRHGHEYDDSNFGFELYKVMNNDYSIYKFDRKIYAVQSIGEVITTELMAGIIYRLKSELGEKDDFVKLIKDVNNVRPIPRRYCGCTG